jgi:hypothetical protein
MGLGRGDDINAATPAMVRLIVQILNPSDGLRIVYLSEVSFEWSIHLGGVK